MSVKRLVVFSGSGISAESGIKTFREIGGLWEEYSIYDVATPEAWQKNKTLVLDFYNQRRKQVLEKQPNDGHLACVELENYFDVDIITQNIDDLHERAGSQKVLHLHGEIRKAQSSLNPNLTYEMDGWEIKLGDKCELGSQLRPHVVWFGEPVPKMDEAINIIGKADILVVVGTSLQVYPAAGLLNYCPNSCKVFLIDPNELDTSTFYQSIEHIKEKAGVGLPRLSKTLIENFA